MSTTHDLSEIWKALRTALLAEGELVSLLADAESIYREWPETKLAFPLIVLECSAENPIGSGASFTGVWRPSLQIDVYAIDPRVCDRINGKIVEKFSMPQNRQTYIESDNFRITQLNLLNGYKPLRSGIKLNGDQEVRLKPCEWQCRVTKKTA